MADQQPIGLKELISQIKRELLDEQDSSQPLFAISGVDLTISFTVARKLNGGIDFKVVQAGADRSTTDVQTVKVTLEPLITIDEVRKKLSPEQREQATKSTMRTFRMPNDT